MNTLLAVLVPAVLVLAIGLPAVYANKPEVESAIATTADVQAFDRLWLEIESLQRDVAAIGADEFRARVVARTAAYLELDASGAVEFEQATERALAEITVAQSHRDAAHRDLDPGAVAKRRDAWRRWQRELDAAADGLLIALRSGPRDQLFAADRLLWLLRVVGSAQGR